MSVLFKKNEDSTLKDLGVQSPILVFAIKWDNKKKDGLLNTLTGKKYEADLDLSCVVYDKNNDRIDCVWYADLTSKDGAIRHKGDDTVGWHEGDDEAVILDLNQLDEEARTLFFVISSFSGDSFSHVENSYWHLFDGLSKQELGRYEFSPHDNSSAKIVMRLQKNDEAGLNEWRIRALDEPATGQNIQEIFPEIRSLIEA